jgi:Meiotically up-regulated gene 113
MLYLICDVTRTKVKVGFSSNPSRRLKQLQTGSSEELILIATCPGDRRREIQLHQWLSPQRKRGEWFTWCDKIDLIIERWAEVQGF